MLSFVQTIVLIAIVCLIAAVFAVGLAWKLRSGLGKSLLLLLAICFLVPGGWVCAALNPWLVDARFRAYRKFYREIHVGMYRVEVMAEVSRCYPPGDPRQRPKLMEESVTSLGFFMNPEHSREPNCEGIFLKLKDNRVISKSYSPD